MICLLGGLQEQFTQLLLLVSAVLWFSKCGFDLLHPTMPPTLHPPKERLKDFFLQLQADCKSMVAESKDEDKEGIEHPLDGKY
jgi:hypothetical protein